MPELPLEPVSVVTVPTLEKGTVVGEFTIIGKLAEGGMGIVYSAEHPKIGKKAAVKVISPGLCTNAEAVGRFADEARAVNAIGHPNIVDIFSFGELDDGRNYFVMEWLQGRALAEVMATGPVELDFALYILDQIADAVDAAHEKEIIHRDLKPDNVFIVDVRGGRHLVKLLDFGIAKLTDNGESIRTRTGLVMGTPGYISPEQARGKDVGFAADVYSLGAMAFELVTGRLPFIADNAMDIVAKHLGQPPPRCSELYPDIPQALDDLFFEALSKDASARPSLSEMRAVIAEVRDSLAGGAAARGYVRAKSPSPSATVIAATELAEEPAAISTNVEATVYAANLPVNRSRRPWLLILPVLAAAAALSVLFLMQDEGGDSQSASPKHSDSATQPGSSVEPAPRPAAAPVPNASASDNAGEKDLAGAPTEEPTEDAVEAPVDPLPDTKAIDTKPQDTAKAATRPRKTPPPKRIRPVKTPAKTPAKTQTIEKPQTPKKPTKNPPKKPLEKKPRNGDYTIDPFAQ